MRVLLLDTCWRTLPLLFCLCCGSLLLPLMRPLEKPSPLPLFFSCVYLTTAAFRCTGLDNVSPERHLCFLRRMLFVVNTSCHSKRRLTIDFFPQMKNKRRRRQQQHLFDWVWTCCTHPMSPRTRIHLTALSHWTDFKTSYIKVCCTFGIF